MQFIEKFKLTHRALKYENRDDIGGIAYINNAVKEGNTVLDIGAHKGGYLYFMQKLVGKEGQVHAFEPQTLLFQYLEKMKPIMHWDHVTINNIALSDNDTPATLYIPSNYWHFIKYETGGFSMALRSLNTSNLAVIKGAWKVIVVTPLDTILGKIFSVKWANYKLKMARRTTEINVQKKVKNKF